MKFCIGLLLLSFAAQLTQAQVPAVAVREAESILVFFRGFEYVEASSLPRLHASTGRLEPHMTDPNASREALDRSVDLARADPGLQKEAREMVGAPARDAWENTMNKIRAEAVLAAKESAKHCPITLFNPSGSCSSKAAEWKHYPAVVGYRVNVPAFLGYTDVKVYSLTVKGSPALVDYLFRSGFIDCGPHLPSEPSCNFTPIRDTEIASDTKQGARVKLVLDNPEDFAEMYRSLQQSKFQLAQSIQQEGKPRVRAQSSSLEKNRTGEMKEPDCEAEIKVCLSATSASMVLGCGGKGEVEIDTKGQISFSMSVGALALNEHDKN